MALLLVDVQNLTHFSSQFRIDLYQAFYHVFMYRRLADTEFFRGLPDRCFCLNHVAGDFYGPFFYIIFQGTPRNCCFLQCMQKDDKPCRLQATVQMTEWLPAGSALSYGVYSECADLAEL